MSDWETEVSVSYGDVVGGDGAGAAFSTRYVKANDDGSFALITSYYYPVDITARCGEDNPDAGRFDVENMTEYLVCMDLEDPGSTEVWSEYEFTHPSATAFVSEEDAKRAARNFATAEDVSVYTWDGEPR